MSRAACATHATISAASASDSPAVTCESQIRTSTVPNEKWGRIDHHTWVYSTIESVRHRKSTYEANASQLPNASGIPQRGKLLVKIWLRALCSPESRPSRNGELEETASSSGSSSRRRSHTSTARSAPRIPTWTCSENVLFRHATYLSPSATRR